ncbi:hypothetical protein PoMZ_12479 [Pyricularia oryzae]|uniref:Uncharacterized protein n=1 Tax=Pyricularia oryzae TaxID=318829 RepID=A0A4P7NSS1_PYROR|nr:hypothetical protein PoMZ_12479 [Pyricularia oryzae]
MRLAESAVLIVCRVCSTKDCGVSAHCVSSRIKRDNDPNKQRRQLRVRFGKSLQARDILVADPAKEILRRAHAILCEPRATIG